jgi:BirA family biotin operon repressor/biotin-[acetyl-CoA-carboxylase] ligase
MTILNDFRKTFATQSERLNNKHFDSIHSDYLNAIYRKKGFHPYRDKQGPFEAAIRDIEPTGYLLLERTNGTISRYNFKEVLF